MNLDTEAGPSRPRRASQPPHTPGQSDMDTDTDADGQSTTPSRRTSSRPASPETAFASRLAEIPDEPPREPTHHLDLAGYPTATLLRLIANLLQQIASSNDQIRPDGDEADDDAAANGGRGDRSSSSRSASRSSSVAANSNGGGPLPSPTTALFSERDRPPQRKGSGGKGIDPASPLPLFSASRTSLVHPSSLLSFHARHVPSISIEAYLLRILKYCPTTNEVFLSLLVYFDRMSRLGTASGVGAGLVGKNGKGFAIDSFNVHRLVIAGVTVASKFFSDVFYTNSRYAKVGGLPPHELNQLELQFLLLNDFRLAIPTEEMQGYGDRLLSFWEGREEETGVDIETGRELSENGRRRAREKREKERATEAVTVAVPSKEDAQRAMEDAEARQNGMDVDQRESEVGTGEVVSDSHPPEADPAQPPPDPAETASAPVHPVDAEPVGNSPKVGSSSQPPTPSTVSSSSVSNQPAPSKTPTAGQTPVPAPASAPAPATPTSTSATSVNGARQSQRTTPVSAQRQGSGSRSMSFSSRGDVNGIGRGWGSGDQGVVAVSGSG